jgi:hypothetical protein
MQTRVRRDEGCVRSVRYPGDIAVAEVENRGAEHAGELPLDELEDEIATRAASIYAGTCRWLELIAELERRGSFTESGADSVSEWLACWLNSGALRHVTAGGARARAGGAQAVRAAPDPGGLRQG